MIPVQLFLTGAQYQHLLDFANANGIAIEVALVKLIDDAEF